MVRPFFPVDQFGKTIHKNNGIRLSTSAMDGVTTVSFDVTEVIDAPDEDDEEDEKCVCFRHNRWGDFRAIARRWR